MKIYKILRAHILLITLLVAVSIIAALLESVGISMVFPILQSMTNMSTASIPFPFNKLSDLFAGMSLSTRFQLVAVILFVSTLIKGIFTYLSGILTGKLQIVVTKHARMDCVRQLMSVSMGYFNNRRASDLQLIIDGYTSSTAGALVNLIGSALPQLFTASIMLALLFMLSWQMTLYSIILVSIASVVLNIYSKRMRLVAQNLIDASYDFNKVLFDILHGMKIIRLFSRERFMVEKFENKVDSFNKATYGVVDISGRIGPLFEVTGIGVLALILFFGAFFVRSQGTAWVGILLAFLVFLTRIISPVKSLNQTRAAIISKLPALHELESFLNSDNKNYIVNGSKTFESLKDSLEFKNVEFGYVAGEVVLDGLDFKVKKGWKVGIVGHSGSGKSTISELLMRFYDPQKGAILLDGLDLKEYDLYSWRRHIGVVSQDIFLFHETVRTNISFGKENATDSEIELAAKRAHAHDFILGLPDGYDTFIGDRGVLLSGGERQRIAIARAILAEPEVLIFDEATSSLDTRSEQIVQQALDEIGKGKTVITIAHRLSTIVDSDMIIVVGEGKIKGMGTHPDLMQNNPVYRKLVEMQKLDPKNKCLA
ncbi:MAG: ABC transporter ATP-binding protein [Candidatus Margulisiibacteriota bacterium]